MTEQQIDDLFITSDRENRLRDIIDTDNDYLTELLDLCDELEGLS